MKHTISNLDIALVQLRTAVQLYNKNNFISSITLAGAAEEILGQIAKDNTGQNNLIEDKIWLDQIMDHFKKPRLGLKIIAKRSNEARNNLKHNDSGKITDVIHVGFFQSDNCLTSV